jgi:hypothetical protein
MLLEEYLRFTATAFVLTNKAVRQTPRASSKVDNIYAVTSYVFAPLCLFCLGSSSALKCR